MEELWMQPTTSVWIQGICKWSTDEVENQLWAPTHLFRYSTCMVRRFSSVCACECPIYYLVYPAYMRRNLVPHSTQHINLCLTCTIVHTTNSTRRTKNDKCYDHVWYNNSSAVIVQCTAVYQTLHSPWSVDWLADWLIDWVSDWVLRWLCPIIVLPNIGA